MIGKFWSIILEYFSAKMGIYLRCTAKDVLLCKRLGLSKSYTVFGLKNTICPKSYSKGYRLKFNTFFVVLNCVMQWKKVKKNQV